MGIRQERRERAEKKKEAIRKEIFDVMNQCADLKNLDPHITANRAIDIMIKRNPQEAHLVTSVCSEIRQDVEKFTKDMVAKYLSINLQQII